MSSNQFNNPFINEETEESKLLKRLKMIFYFLITLAILRIFSLQFIWMINDLLAATIVYCTYMSKDKFMALFCIITSIMSIIYELSIGPVELARYKSSNNSTNIQNLNNLITANNKTKYSTSDNYDQKLFDEDLNSNSFDFIYNMMIITLVFALIVYSFLVYYSSKAFSQFRNPFDSQDSQRDNGPYLSRNYGTIQDTRNSTVNNTNSGFVPFAGRGVTIG